MRVYVYLISSFLSGPTKTNSNGFVSTNPEFYLLQGPETPCFWKHTVAPGFRPDLSPLPRSTSYQKGALQWSTWGGRVPFVRVGETDVHSG